MSIFTYNNKELTITKKDLTKKEASLVSSLVSLGDSEEVALWTVEHQERKINRGDGDQYAFHCI